MVFDLAWLVGAVVLMFGSWVQTTLGFGLAVVAAPFLVWISPSWVPVVLTITALLLSIINTWNQRLDLHVSSMITPMITRIPGTVVGVWLLSIMSSDHLQIFVSVTVMLAVVVSLMKSKFEASALNLGIAGAVSGFTGSTTAIGGPPMAVVLQHGKPASVRANLSLYFTYSCIISLLGYYWVGMLSHEIIVLSLSFIPFMLFGFFIGKGHRKHISAERFRKSLLLVCFIAAVAALAGVLA